MPEFNGGPSVHFSPKYLQPRPLEHDSMTREMFGRGARQKNSKKDVRKTCGAKLRAFCDGRLCDLFATGFAGACALSLAITDIDFWQVRWVRQRM